MSYDAPQPVAEPPRCQAQCAEGMSEIERRVINEQIRQLGPANHNVWRVTEEGYQSTPCWCAADGWHRVGKEVLAATPESTDPHTSHEFGSRNA